MQKTQECLLERREAVGRGTWLSPLPFGVHRHVPWQQGREDLFLGSGKGLQQAKSSTADWVGWEWVSNVIFPKAPHGGGASPVNTQQDPDVLGREAVRESARASMTQWPLCKLSLQAGPRGCYNTAWIWSCLPPRPDTYSREQQQRQADQCRAADGAGKAPSAVPSPTLAHHELSSRLLNNHLSQRDRQWLLTVAVIHTCLATLLELPLLGALGVASTDFLYVQGMYPRTGHLGQVTGHPPHPYGP